MLKVETETNAANIIRRYAHSATLRTLRDAATAVRDGECQFMPVVWAVDALGEAIADEEDTTEAETELEATWAKYQAAQGR